ncbi:type VII secretion system-associated protein [Streptomyces sp. P9(2023)]|uniref:type VII secretion system-associated protein n=1 Tax=Streptomyces sp. P9(2023) TaxID=3064394 RepID=UPI0028F44A9F|nr:type VII secretion system-associated protein [Streptomyces sp. P9(2023)]MDT9687459.1 type VII secretion system-associated protein [Streptomyces sp. P9(2023)]
MRPVFGSTTKVYMMVHPVRTVPRSGPVEGVPYTVRVSARSHVNVVLAPSSATGPTAVQVPLTGHNLLFEISADAGEAVVVERFTLGPTSHSALDADGISVIQSQYMPPFSADFVDAVQRSLAAYEPMKAPDREIDLDAGTLRRLADDVPSLPLRVPANGTGTIVFAPVTEARDLVRWTLLAEVSCAGRTQEHSWEMTLTAETCMREMAGPAPGRRLPVHEWYPDHWHPGASRGDIASGVLPGSLPIPLAHTSSDGSGTLRLPPLDTEPESKKATRLRTRGNRHAARGRMDRARAAYAAAAEEGSAEAAYWLGYLADAGGDLDAALRWYTQAAERRFFPAFNDLAVLHHRRGELDRAELWFRRGMDAGDWTAAAGLGALLWRRGDAEAEAVLRMVKDTPAGDGAVAVIGDSLALSDRSAAASAADMLAELLHEQGRTDEAVEVWEQAAANGRPHAAFSLGRLCHDRGDRAGAERWWRESAEAGFPLGAYRLGALCHEDGRTDEAERWWRKAAEVLEQTLAQGASTRETGTGRTIMIGRLEESGEVRAAYELGMSLLDRGRSAEAEAEAEHWLTLAARGGHRAALYEIAEDSDGSLGPRDSIPATGTPGDWEEPMARAIRQDGWLVLPKPGWNPGVPSDTLPVDAMVGGWQLDDEGRPGPFQPNPHHVPDDRSSPTDPVHELLRLVGSGQEDGVAERLLSTLRNAVVEIACDGPDRLLVGPSPDGVPCVAVATAAIHKRRLREANWVPVLGSTLPDILPADVDILINPGDVAQFRLLTEALRA